MGIRNRVRNVLGVTVLVAALAPLRVFAWGDIGHGAVGYIAEKNLTKKAQALIHQLNGQEPLAVSAVFPDQVRSDSRYSEFSPYHFLTIPTNSKIEKDANVIISQVPALLLGHEMNRQQKVVLLRYLIHVIGDVHQPLHVGNPYDMGGNLCDVHWKNPETGEVEKINLHKIWDEGIITDIRDEFWKKAGSKKWFGYKEMGDLALADAAKLGVDYASANTASPEEWYQGSFKLHSVAYPDAEPGVAPENRTYCKQVDPNTGKIVNGRYDASTIPTLDDDYVKRSIPVIEKQILLGGYRLAGVLNKLAEKSSVSDWSDEKAKAFFAPLMLKVKSDRTPQSKRAKTGKVTRK